MTKLRIDSRDRHLHVFGQVAPTTFPSEQNFDANLTNPIEGAGEIDCTAISDCDVGTDQTKIIYDVNDLWLLVPNKYAGGVDPRETLGAMIKQGLQPIDHSQPRDKRWNSYFRADTGGFDAFDNTRSAMLAANSSVTVATGWYSNWNVGAGNVMPIGVNQVSGHDYKVSGWVTINGEPMFIVKPWLGYTMFMPRATYNAAVRQWGCGAYMPSNKQIDNIFTKSLIETLTDFVKNVLLALKEITYIQ